MEDVDIEFASFSLFKRMEDFKVGDLRKILSDLDEHVGLGTHCVGYIFNLFVNGEYANIPSSYNNICEATKVLTEEWNKWQ